VQGMSGLMSITGPADGEPHKVGVAVTDLFTGLYAANAVQAALLARERSGRGQYIDMALFDCALAMLANVGMNFLVSGATPPRLGNAHPNIVPYQVFAAADGHFILACGNDKQFRAVAELIGEPSLAQDERFATNPARVAHRNELVGRLAEAFRADTRDDWLSRLDAAGVPCGPINSVAEAFADPQAVARGMRIEMQDAAGQTVPLIGCPVRLSDTPAVYRQAPPKLGEHTAAVLAELGYDREQIATLQSSGTV
jgi:crotonobetainyl-CoA:carnitine CoA-transferase CaiB-like acyl-CoA transferase